MSIDQNLKHINSLLKLKENCAHISKQIDLLLSQIKNFLHANSKYFTPTDVEDIKKVTQSGMLLKEEILKIIKIDITAEQIQGMKNLYDFFSRVRHDFRNPINIAKGYLEILLEKFREKNQLDLIKNYSEIVITINNILRSIDEIRISEENEIILKTSDFESIQSIETDEYRKFMKSISILIVDDDKENREVLSRYLKLIGYENIFIAKSGVEALEIVSNSVIDIMLLDIEMPIMTGTQVLSIIKQYSNPPSVLMISGYDFMVKAIECIKLGAEDYILKPFNTELLRVRIMACIEKKWAINQLGLQTKALSRANVSITNLYVELENYKKELESRNMDLSEANEEIINISEITRAVNSTLDIDQIMPIIIKNINQIIYCQGLIIQLLDKEKKHISIYKSYGTNRLESLKKWQLDVESDQSISIDVINSKKYVYIQDIKNQNNISEKDMNLYKLLNYHYIIYYPLEIKKEIVGCILLFGKENVELNQKKLDYLNNIFLNIGTSINNSALYNDLKRTKLELFESEKLVSLTKVFEEFVPREFLQKIAKRGIDKIEFNYVTKQPISILFSDIRAFTSFSESVEPKLLLEFMNEYFQVMDTEIYKHGGFIDKFIGDAMMVIFEHQENVPFTDATRAVNAAIDMQNMLKSFNATNVFAKQHPISIGIGIHTGEVILGIVGSSHHHDTTAIGDNVNIASRLENMNRLYSTKILISQNTFDQLDHKKKHFYSRPLGTAPIRGRIQSIDIWEIFNNDEKSVIELKMKSLPLLKKGLHSLQENDWINAKKFFAQALVIYPEDSAIKFLLQLSEERRNI